MNNRVLLADDSAAIRLMLGDVLQGAGYEVRAAENGEEAYEIAQNFQPALVITDLNMPVQDGIGLIKNLRKHPSFKFIPILVLSTEDHKEKIARGKDAGASGWMVKPFSPDRLITVVKKVCGHF